MTHKHQPRWTNEERLDLLDLDDGGLHSCIVADGRRGWLWTCQECEVQGLEPGPDPAGAWSAFLDHERSIHLEPIACLECAEPLVQMAPRSGRPRKYCCDACRQRSEYYAAVARRFDEVSARARAALDG
jgi:hypothetical protein